MSPKAGIMLVNEILPIIRGTVPRRVKPAGAEDYEEIIQDTLAMAASMVDSAERKGKEIIAQSIAYYAIQAAKSGRRSTYAGRMDAMSAAAELDGHCTVDSMDASLSSDTPTLGDLLADKRDDPATYAARELDWAEFMASLDERSIAVVVGTAQGRMNQDLALTLGVSAPRMTQIKRKIAGQIREAWGENILAEAENKPAWRKAMEWR